MAQEESLPGLERIAGTPYYQLFRYVWDRLTQLRTRISGPIEGTLSPDTKPRLATRDAGTLFYATDFGRTYRWSGTVWQDAPGATPRFQISIFQANPEPAVGWAKCNGASTFRSTSDGRTTFFEVPNIPPDDLGFSSWIRL